MVLGAVLVSAGLSVGLGSAGAAPQTEVRFMLMWLLRGCFVALLVGIAVFAFSFFFAEDVNNPWAGIAIGGGILAVGGVVLWTDMRERDKQIATLLGLLDGNGLALGQLSNLLNQILGILGGL